jgi:hypothetical protein
MYAQPSLDLESETRGTSRDIPFTILDYFGLRDWRDNQALYRGKSLLSALE